MLQEQTVLLKITNNSMLSLLKKLLLTAMRKKQVKPEHSRA